MEHLFATSFISAGVATLLIVLALQLHQEQGPRLITAGLSISAILMAAFSCSAFLMGVL